MSERLHLPQGEITTLPDAIQTLRHFALEHVPQVNSLSQFAESTAEFRKAMASLVDNRGERDATSPWTTVWRNELPNQDRLYIQTEEDTLHIERTSGAEIWESTEKRERTLLGDIQESKETHIYQVEKPVYQLDFPINESIPLTDDPSERAPVIGIKRNETGMEEVHDLYYSSSADELKSVLKMMKLAAIDTLMILQTQNSQE